MLGSKSTPLARIDDIKRMSVRDALKRKEGRILRQFPSEYLEGTVQDVLERAQAGNRSARRARKLLLGNEYDKE